MSKVLDLVVGTLKGLGKTEATELGRDIRAEINDKVASTDPTFDNDLVEVFDGFLEGLGDDTATKGSPETGPA